MDNWIQRFRSSTTINANDKVLIPGDPERRIEAERMENGIPLLPAVIDDLKLLAAKYSVGFMTGMK